MYIHEAVSLAMAKGKFIRRTTSEEWRFLVVEPTNDRRGCFIFPKSYGKRDRYENSRWVPTADELMADDWELVN